ncbi:hypothetical protein ACIRYZ_23090 [Kitasatospora sp. NPDC101155]|uniref:hypothetical protein n=1 Tax=Kitasatospora sp. NPDC101155 TaxID=3364097 RepID=UPI003804C2CE
MTVTRVCRRILEGSSPEEAREHFADAIGALSEDDRGHLDFYVDGGERRARWGIHTAVSWVAGAASSRWRFLLNPAEAKPSYGDPYRWLTPADELAELARRFAETAVQALQTWQPKEHLGISRDADLRWVHAMLVHVPEVTPAVKKTVQLMIHDAQRGQDRPRSYDYRERDDHRQFTELLAAITRIVAASLPQAPAARRAALGDPTEVTPRSLSTVAADALDEYLDRHAGDDQLVEKALLSFAWRDGCRRESAFSDVLARHSNPQQAIRTLTHDLRRRLGGNPTDREAWAQYVLALPECGTETILALPAWTALKTSGSRYDTTHPAVLALVAGMLGNDHQAWQRLADSPISYSSPNARLRLGDVLSAAADGTDWPKPPASR